MNPSTFDRRHAAYAFLLYLLFVVYGSLVPFEYRPHTLEQAVETFRNIPYLDLEVVSRADWIANIVLYIPLAFLCCVWFMGMRNISAAEHITLMLVFALCVSVAVLVEFIQIFFAPRTVSVNDLVAETLGTLGGILLWVLGRERMAALWDAFHRGGRQSVLAVVATYGAGYVALSLFPYDFVISSQELSWKLESDMLGWLVAGRCVDWVRCGAHLAADAVAVAPLGVFLLLAAPATSLLRVFVAGLVLGLVLEGMQLFLASGISQGLSVVMRGVGLVAGAAVGRLLMSIGPVPVARLVWRATPFLAIPYLLSLALLSGWFSAPWLPLDQALARFTDLRYMPFYYHYFTSEPAAMASLLANVVMYAPVGLALWAGETSQAISKRGVLRAALWAGCLALPIELGKLMVQPKHPDFTNLLIAGVGAAFTFALARWIEHVLSGAPSQGVAGPAARPTARPMAPVAARPSSGIVEWPMPRPYALLLGFPALLAVGVGVLNYPMGGPVLSLCLLAYGVLLWRWPMLWLFSIPALLPVLDLSPLTGRLPLDEFDLFVLVTIAVGYPRYSRVRARPWKKILLPVAFVLLWVSWGLAMARGLWGLLGVELAVSSHSPLESWLVGKGMLWALLLVPLIRRLPPDATKRALDHVLGGLAAGLGALTLAVLWERHVFVGLLDLDSVFRVTGTFSSMHTGGAYIEAFIAFAFPALAVWVLKQKSQALKVLGIAAAALAGYAMLVTFSRGGYAGFAAGLFLVVFGALRGWSGLPGRRWLAPAGLTVAVIAVSLPFLSGGFAQQRLARATEDFSLRQAHWGRALAIMDDGIVASLTGMGFGQYSTVYLLHAPSRELPGTFAILRESDDPYLRLGSGESSFLDQVVEMGPGMQYQLTARVRRPEGEGPLSIPLCEKALLYSFECVWNQLEPSKAGWSTLSIQGDSKQLGAGGYWPHRGVKLALYNPGSSAIDVDDVSLKTQGGRELIVNGDFGKGVERWLFTTDQRLAWHIDQQWVETYFAQGLLGVVAMVMLLIAVARVLGPRVLVGDLSATAFAAALVGFLTVGLLGSTMDTARLSMLFYLGAFCAGLLVQHLPSQRPGS